MSDYVPPGGDPTWNAALMEYILGYNPMDPTTSMLGMQPSAPTFSMPQFQGMYGAIPQSEDALDFAKSSANYLQDYANISMDPAIWMSAGTSALSPQALTPEITQSVIDRPGMRALEAYRNRPNTFEGIIAGEILDNGGTGNSAISKMRQVIESIYDPSTGEIRRDAGEQLDPELVAQAEEYRRMLGTVTIDGIPTVDYNTAYDNAMAMERAYLEDPQPGRTGAIYNDAGEMVSQGGEMTIMYDENGNEQLVETRTQEAPMAAWLRKNGLSSPFDEYKAEDFMSGDWAAQQQQYLEGESQMRDVMEAYQREQDELAAYKRGEISPRSVLGEYDPARHVVPPSTSGPRTRLSPELAAERNGGMPAEAQAAAAEVEMQPASEVRSGTGPLGAPGPTPLTETVWEGGGKPYGDVATKGDYQSTFALGGNVPQVPPPPRPPSEGGGALDPYLGNYTPSPRPGPDYGASATNMQQAQAAALREAMLRQILPGNQQQGQAPPANIGAAAGGSPFNFNLAASPGAPPQPANQPGGPAYMEQFNQTQAPPANIGAAAGGSPFNFNLAASPGAPSQPAYNPLAPQAGIGEPRITAGGQTVQREWNPNWTQEGPPPQPPYNPLAPPNQPPSRLTASGQPVTAEWDPNWPIVEAQQRYMEESGRQGVLEGAQNDPVRTARLKREQAVREEAAMQEAMRASVLSEGNRTGERAARANQGAPGQPSATGESPYRELREERQQPSEYLTGLGRQYGETRTARKAWDTARRAREQERQDVYNYDYGVAQARAYMARREGITPYQQQMLARRMVPMAMGLSGSGYLPGA